MKKISEWAKCLELSAFHLEPHRLPFYMYELASLFHTYWNSGNEDDNLKILNEKNLDLQSSRLFLIKKIQLVLKSGLDILNVNAPTEM
jgi:arginyl-tRNA synthetase